MFNASLTAVQYGSDVVVLLSKVKMPVRLSIGGKSAGQQPEVYSQILNTSYTSFALLKLTNKKLCAFNESFYLVNRDSSSIFFTFLFFRDSDHTANQHEKGKKTKPVENPLLLYFPIRNGNEKGKLWNCQLVNGQHFCWVTEFVMLGKYVYMYMCLWICHVYVYIS